jgi:hypothetical protein
VLETVDGAHERASFNASQGCVRVDGDLERVRRRRRRNLHGDLPDVAGAVDAAAATASYGDAARGIFSGSAFDRVWDVGNTTEILSTIALLCCAVIGSFAFTTTLRQLIYVMHRETVARWTPPPPPPPEDPDAAKKGIGGMLRKLQFWRKDEGGDAEEKPPTPTPAAN